MLAEFGWVYEQMGSLGWPHSEVDEMEVWEIARHLGIGRDDPVAAGSRGIVLPSDDQGSQRKSGGGRSRRRPFRDPKLKARIAEYEARQRGET